jgi:DNA-binding CsgD family transcriptional regulator
LLAEAVYDDLLPGERTRMHAAYASALTKGGIDGTAAELARHARESHDLATAYQASVRAGDEAMQVAAPAEAMQHYEAAVALSDHAPDADEQNWGGLVRAAAEAAAAAGDQLRAIDLIRDTLAQLPPQAPPVNRAKLLYDLATYTFTIESDDPLGWTTEAVGLMSTQPVTAFRARVAALHARANTVMGRDVEAARWAQEALAMADELGQPEAAADARTTLAMLQRKAGDPMAAARDLQAVIDDAQRSGEITAELRSRYSLGSLHYEVGDLAAAAEAFQAGADRAARTGRQWAAYGLGCLILLSLVQYVRGDWDASLRTADTSDRPPPPLPEAELAAVAMAVRAGRGDQSALQLLPLVRPWWRRDGMIAILTAGPAMELYSQAGQPERALELFDEVSEVISEIWQEQWYLARIRLSALAVAAVSTAVADQPTARRAAWVARASELVDGGRTSAERGVPEGRHLGIEGVAWLARLEAEWARLRWLAGPDAPDADEHIGLWQRSVELFGFGDVYEQARARTRLAAVLRAAGRGMEAAEQAALAREVARRLRAEPLLDEIRALGTSRGPSRETAAPGAGSLTSRERDVLALLVAGRTNRQISQQLYISAKTVSVHVSNILAKLGVNSRAEAAALARRDRTVR